MCQIRVSGNKIKIKCSVAKRFSYIRKDEERGCISFSQNFSDVINLKIHEMRLKMKVEFDFVWLKNFALTDLIFCIGWKTQKKTSNWFFCALNLYILRFALKFYFQCDKKVFFCVCIFGQKKGRNKTILRAINMVFIRFFWFYRLIWLLFSRNDDFFAFSVSRETLFFQKNFPKCFTWNILTSIAAKDLK